MDEPTSRESDTQRTPLDQFRTKPKRLKVHPLEQTVLAAVCVHLIFLPWALGGNAPWARAISLGLSIVGFAISLWPRNYTEEHTGGTSFRLIPWPKLLKFPLFWIGLALLGYIGVQALNPAWVYVEKGTRWWMQTISFVRWLPSGVAVPFENGGQLRMLMIYGATWLTLCAIWVGFTRRRTLQLFFIVLAMNGAAVALLGLVQRFWGNGKIFWFHTSMNSTFFGSFIYKNHAGAFLLLVLSLICGLVGWYYLRGLRRMEKSNPSGVFAFFATGVAIAIVVSHARGITLVMCVFLALCIAAFGIHQFLIPRESRRPVIALGLLVIFGIFLKAGWDVMGSTKAMQSIRAGLNRQDASLSSRESATKASFDMLRDYGWRGAGSGSFRFLFPIYQQNYPELGQGTFTWLDAHNDIVQLPIELGAAGTVILLTGAAFVGFWLLRGYFWANPLSACVVLGAGLLFGSAWWDFPFQCPAILDTWCALLLTAAMWAQMEERRAGG